MLNIKHSCKLLVAFAMSILAVSAFADESAIAGSIEKLKASKQRERKQVVQQSLNFAEQYRKTAEVVRMQGGDPTPLLKAAAYFEKKAR